MKRIEGVIATWWTRVQTQRQIAACLRQPLPALRIEPALVDSKPSAAEVADRRAAYWHSEGGKEFAASLAKIEQMRQRTTFQDFSAQLLERPSFQEKALLHYPVTSLARFELSRVVEEYAMGNAREPRS